MLNTDQVARLVKPLKGLRGFTAEKSDEAAESLRECVSEHHAIKAVKAALRRDVNGVVWYPTAAQMAECVAGTMERSEGIDESSAPRKAAHNCLLCIGTGWVKKSAVGANNVLYHGGHFCKCLEGSRADRCQVCHGDGFLSRNGLATVHCECLYGQAMKAYYGPYLQEAKDSREVEVLR